MPKGLGSFGLEGRIDRGQSVLEKVIDVVTTSRQPLIAARTSPERKALFASLAASRGLSESALLTLLVDAVLERNASCADALAFGKEKGAASERVSLRLRPGDRRLVNARAAARSMKPASYLVALIRAHVRRQAPLPTAELNTLKVTVAQLSAIARSLQREEVLGAAAALGSEFACNVYDIATRVDEVRQLVREIVRTNLLSWEAGDA